LIAYWIFYCEKDQKEGTFQSSSQWGAFDETYNYLEGDMINNWETKNNSMGIRRTPVNSNPRGGYIHGRSKCAKGNGYVSKCCCSNNGSKTIEENICHYSVPM
jgi:hypothetical protein